MKSAMQKAHAALDVYGMVHTGKSPHAPAVHNGSEGNRPMFVRAVWRLKRLVDIRQTLREMDVPTTRDADLLGLSGPDFSKMTKGLFDR